MGCTVCGIGHYAASSGQTKCTDCEPGRFSDIAGPNVACRPCPAGYFTKESASVGCDACTARASACGGMTRGARARSAGLARTHAGRRPRRA